MATPPVYPEIELIYPNEPHHLQKTKERFQRLESLFQKEFGTTYDFAVRAPGRVNLIGEHVDYSGYGVLPMAIEQDSVVLVKLLGEDKKSTLNLRSSNPTKYPSRDFDNVTADLHINDKVHEWSNYFLAGVKGVLEHLNLKSSSQGWAALVDGTVPIGSGLSSSSALVCAAALATTTANKGSISKTDLATLCMKSERYIGLESGGMDQAISYLGEKGKAQFIEFDPLRTKDVILPEGACFVIANSLVESNKYVTAGTCYNMRVVECRLASVLLANKLGLPEWKETKRLIQVQQATGKSLSELMEEVQKHLKESAYTLDEIAAELSLDKETVTKNYLAAINPSSSFELHKRAYHVYRESNLVHQFSNVCKGSQSPADKLVELGKLMDQSHDSCNRLFDCSCPELNTLTSICRKSGAFGSRLTGAGWGGCTISLVPADKLESFISQVKAEYYKDFLKLSDERINDGTVIFDTEPGVGAAVLKKN